MPLEWPACGSVRWPLTLAISSHGGAGPSHVLWRNTNTGREKFKVCSEEQHQKSAAAESRPAGTSVEGRRSPSGQKTGPHSWNRWHEEHHWCCRGNHQYRLITASMYTSVNNIKPSLQTWNCFWTLFSLIWCFRNWKRFLFQMISCFKVTWPGERWSRSFNTYKQQHK